MSKEPSSAQANEFVEHLRRHRVIIRVLDELAQVESVDIQTGYVELRREMGWTTLPISSFCRYLQIGHYRLRSM